MLAGVWVPNFCQGGPERWGWWGSKTWHSKFLTQNSNKNESLCLPTAGWCLSRLDSWANTHKIMWFPSYFLHLEDVWVQLSSNETNFSPRKISMLECAKPSVRYWYESHHSVNCGLRFCHWVYTFRHVRSPGCTAPHLRVWQLSLSFKPCLKLCSFWCSYSCASFIWLWICPLCLFHPVRVNIFLCWCFTCV